MLGVWSALTMINNFEFGLTAFLSVNATFAILAFFNIARWKLWWINIGSSAAIFVSFSLLMRAFQMPLQLKRYTAFSAGFGNSGFGNVPMPFFGTFFLLFSILGLGVATGIYILRDEENQDSGDVVRKIAKCKTSALLLYSGTWGILSFPYYIGRSITSGQLQIFLIPTSLCIFGLASIHIKLVGTSSGFFKFEIPARFHHAPLLFLIILPVVSVLQIPNPSFEWARLFGKGEEFSSESISNLEVVESVDEYLEKYPGAKIGFLGNWGNLVALKTGIFPVTDQNTLNDSTITPNLSKSLCKSIQSAYPKQLLVEHWALPVPDLSVICKNVSFDSKWSPSLDVYNIDAPLPETKY